MQIFGADYFQHRGGAFQVSISGQFKVPSLFFLYIFRHAAAYRLLDSLNKYLDGSGKDKKNARKFIEHAVSFAMGQQTSQVLFHKR